MILKGKIQNRCYMDFDKNRNGVIGAVAGDIAGSHYEFLGLKMKDFPLFNRYDRFTDDSILTLIITKTLLECNGDYKNLQQMLIDYMKDIGRLYVDTAGYGGMFFEWLFSEDNRPYNSCGNGSAMRVSAVPYFANNLDEVKALSKLVTEITHNHPEGIKGAEATAVVEWLALNGKTKEEIKEYVEKNYYPMNYTEGDLFKNYKFEDLCQETVPQCIFAFLISNSYEDALKKVIGWGGDTDTMGAITGAMAGAYYGVPNEIQNCAKSFLDKRMLKIVNLFCNYLSKE